VKRVIAAQNGDAGGNPCGDMGGNPCGDMGGNPCGDMGGNPCGNPCGMAGPGMNSNDSPDPPVGDPALTALCWERWPEQGAPKQADTQKCVDFFATSNLGIPQVWKLTAAELHVMATKISQCKSCSHLREAHDYLMAAADSHFDLMDPWSHLSIDPVLTKMLAGKKIETRELMGVASVTLWRLRNAPYARHGRPFKSPDLQTFFYEKLGRSLTPNPAFKDSMLDKIDEQNVATVVSEIKRRGEQ
jgi:hypothetical protein